VGEAPFELEELDKPRWMTAAALGPWHDGPTVVRQAAFGPYWDDRLGVNIDALENSAAFARVAAAITATMDEFLEAFPPAVSSKIDVRGLLFEPGAWGLHVDLRRSDRARTHGLFVNPLEPLYRFGGNLDQAVAGVVAVIIHEITHETYGGGEDENFAYGVGENTAIIGTARQRRAFTRLKDAYGTTSLIRRRTLAPELADLLQKYSSAPRPQGGSGQPGGGSRRYDRRPAGERGGQAGLPDDTRHDPPRADAARTVTEHELRELARVKGTSVDAQRERARAAGYTIVDARAGGAPPVAQATVLPGAQAFVDRDVLPGFKAAFKDAGEARTGILALWSPGTVSPDAETMGAVMRANLALRRQRTLRAQKAMRALEVAWDKQPQAAQLAFAMAVDEGRIDDLPAWQQDVARLLTEINTKKRNEANTLGGKVGYVEHYFPREWVQPGKVREFVQRALYGKRPLQGRAGFKKARARDKDTGDVFSFRQLHAAGFEPVSYNPITAHLRKWLEMDKWIAARRILLEGKRFGVATFVSIGDEAPEGQVRYPESFGTVYGPPTVQVHEAYDARLMTALHAFAESLGVTTVRKVRVGGTRWGYAVGDSKIVTKFAGPETVLEHEIGHILDERYGLRDRWVKNPRMKKELRALADLRFEGTAADAVPASFKRYVRKGPEKIANLVHAFIYNPGLAKEVAPNAYWALYNLAKETPALRPLLDLQKTKSLVLAAAAADVSVGGLVIKGHYYGPPDAVRLLANHLSPGLRGHALFNLYRRAGNVLNQVQLGLSAFHLVMTSVDQVVGKSGMVLEHLSRGQVGEAAKKALLVPSRRSWTSFAATAS
jgi:hypothetical protein